MRTLSRLSYLFSVLFALISLILHFRSLQGVWAGIPYRADVMNYPNLWLDRWVVAAAVAGVIFFIYGMTFALFAASVHADNEMERYSKLRVLSDKS